MSKVIAPECNIKCLPSEWCPPVLPHCKGNCVSVMACDSIRIPIPIPSCNPFTGNEITSRDVTAARIVIYGYDNDGRLIKLAPQDLLGGDIVGDYPHQIIWSPTDTEIWPSGIASVEVEIIVTDPVTAGQHTFKPVQDFSVCIERPRLAVACVVVSGQTADEPFTVNADTVTLYVHNSDTGDPDRVWTEFVINWGDGNIDTVVPTNPMDATNAVYTHTYTETPTSGIVVSGTTSFNSANPCDEALTDQTPEICVALHIP